MGIQFRRGDCRDARQRRSCERCGAGDDQRQLRWTNSQAPGKAGPAGKGRRMKRLSPGALALLILFTVSTAKATIRYSVSVEHPEQHFFHVTMTVPKAGSDFRVQIPAWNALYQIRDFASRVQGV